MIEYWYIERGLYGRWSQVTSFVYQMLQDAIKNGTAGRDIKFPLHTLHHEEVKNATITGHFGFVF